LSHFAAFKVLQKMVNLSKKCCFEKLNKGAKNALMFISNLLKKGTKNLDEKCFQQKSDGKI
jgi:hypothetical protein